MECDAASLFDVAALRVPGTSEDEPKPFSERMLEASPTRPRNRRWTQTHPGRGFGGAVPRRCGGRPTGWRRRPRSDC